MNKTKRAFICLSAVVVILALFMPIIPVNPQETEPPKIIVLVAKRQFVDRLYSRKVLLLGWAKNQNFGFILNMPTRVTLGALFPEHAPSQKIKEPVYFGGPEGNDKIYATIRAPKEPGAMSAKIADGLYVTFARDEVDILIERGAENARFLAGIVLWKPGELDEEIRKGWWYMAEISQESAFGKSTTSLWDDLVRHGEEAENKENMI